MLFQPQLIRHLPTFLLWAILIIVPILVVILQKKLGKIFKYCLWISLAASIIIGGILLGAVPNPLMPIIFVKSSIETWGPFISILLPVPLILLFITSFFFGRMFCGYACPVGAAQELVSKIKFKSTMKKQKKVRGAIIIPQKYTKIIRWSFFGFVVVIMLIWGFIVLDYFNPFPAFQLFQGIIEVTIWFSFIILIASIILGIFIYRPWCQLFCPFGAFASLASRFSLFKFRRNDNCTECKICETICPTREAYEDSNKGECYACNRCIEACPVDAIKFEAKFSRFKDIGTKL